MEGLVSVEGSASGSNSDLCAVGTLIGSPPIVLIMAGNRSRSMAR